MFMQRRFFKLTLICLAAIALLSCGGAKERKVRAIEEGDGEAVRRRRATANRTLHILKAALNQAFREGRVATDEANIRRQASLDGA